MTDLERQILDRCTDELGAPAGLMAEEFGVSTAAITKAAKKLQTEKLLEDTGWAMKKRRDGNWDWIESKKTEGGMTTRPGASTVWKTTYTGLAVLGFDRRLQAKETTMAARKPNQTKQAEAAGSNYAVKQIQSEYFEQWVYDQLVEASKMPPESVLPLKTADDARKAARNMFQQLEWDTKRELSNHDLERLSGGDVGTNAAFWKGFHKSLQDSVPWLADTILTMNREIRGGMRHAGAHPITRRPTEHARLGAPRPGTRVRDYIAVDNRGRQIAGPFKSYADAKDAAGPGGHTQFVPSPRGVARNVRRGRHRAHSRA